MVDSDSFQSKDETNQAGWRLASLTVASNRERTTLATRGRQSRHVPLGFNPRLAVTWCGQFSPQFLTACVWAAQSHRPSPPCRRLSPCFPPPGPPPLASPGSSAPGISPAASLQSTASPPRRISLSLIPPASRREDRRGGKESDDVGRGLREHRRAGGREGEAGGRKGRNEDTRF